MSLSITGGLLKGRKLLGNISRHKTRPTTSMMRQALFNILQNRIEGFWFLDLFAGSGIMGIEALSRKAEMAVFVEKDKQTAALIRQNLKALGLEKKGRVILSSIDRAFSILTAEESCFDYVYMDPPYKHFKENQFLEEKLLLLKQAEICQKEVKIFVELPNNLVAETADFKRMGWKLEKVRKYGKSSLACLSLF